MSRAGRISVSHAFAGASKPSSALKTTGSASGPSRRVSSATCCHANRKRRKSRAATGSISDAQPPDRIMMDARQQAPVAPLLVVEAGKEAPLENCAFAFERGERRRDSARLKSERRGKRRRRDRPETLEPAAQDLDQRALRSTMSFAACSAGAAISGSSRASGQRARN